MAFYKYSSPYVHESPKVTGIWVLPLKGIKAKNEF